MGSNHASLRAAWLLMFLAGCQSSQPPQVVRTAASVPTSCLSQLEDMSGASLPPEVIAGFGDPVALRIFQRGAVCPTTFREIVTLLQKSAKATESFGIHILSERGAVMGNVQPFRALFGIVPQDGYADDSWLFFADQF